MLNLDANFRPPLKVHEPTVLIVLRTLCGCEKRWYQRGRPTTNRITVPLESRPRPIATDEPLENVSNRQTRTFKVADMVGDPWSESWLFVEEGR